MHAEPCLIRYKEPKKHGGNIPNPRHKRHKTDPPNKPIHPLKHHYVCFTCIRSSSNECKEQCLDSMLFANSCASTCAHYSASCQPLANFLPNKDPVLAVLKIQLLDQLCVARIVLIQRHVEVQFIFTGFYFLNNDIYNRN